MIFEPLSDDGDCVLINYPLQMYNNNNNIDNKDSLHLNHTRGVCKKKIITPHSPFSSKRSSDGCLRPESDNILFEFRIKTCKKKTTTTK